MGVDDACLEFARGMTGSALSRTLALVFTDLADSTALKAERGDRAAGDLIERHRAIVRRLASDWGGRVIDWAGDGCFLTFETPSAAVTFSLHLQRAHLDSPDLPGVRIGAHMGEVSERPGPAGDAAPPRIEGLGVDLAARIAGLARPGQLLMSAAVADSARRRIDTSAFREPPRWATHGRYEIKGFGEPVEIHEAGFRGLTRFGAPPAGEKAWPVSPAPSSPGVRGKSIAAACALMLAAAIAYLAWPDGPLRGAVSQVPAPRGDASGAPAFGGRPAIAVLPFDDLSPDPEQAFFADGLAEDLITRLASWRAFPVIARNSSFQYRGGDLDLKRVGAELGARYLVEGSVRRVDDRIRVTAQLIDASTAEHVWAEAYDRTVEDVFDLQDEIGSTIAASLVGDLTRAEGERARQQGTENLEAWSLYQLGLQHADRYTASDSVQAVRFFERALALDPRFATAQARLAMANWMIVSGDGRVASDEELAAALAAARRAVELDPRDPVAHAALGAVHLTAGDPRNAIDATRKAVELNPSMPEAWIWFGWAQLLAGDPEACIVATRRAQDLDPQRPNVWIYEGLALASWETGRYEEALEAARRLVALQPTYFTGHLYVAMSAVSLGRLDEARAAIAEGRRVRPDLSIDLMQNYLAVSRPELDARRNAALRDAGLR
jgi:TolB-like protein/class 3 adenylate cyclase